MSQDTAITGSDPIGARSFAPTFTTSPRSAATIARGGYALVASVDCWVKLGDSGVSAAVPNTTQPSTANDSVFCPAGTQVPLNVKADGLYFSVIGVSASGTLNISGPLAPGV